MAHLINGEANASITSAWLAATEHLSGGGRDREEFDLVVEMLDPAPAAADPRVVASLNSLLRRRYCQVRINRPGVRYWRHE